MTEIRDPLQQSMVGDFHKILGAVPNLLTAWEEFSEAERRKVENAYLEWVWQMMFAGTMPASEQTSDDAVARMQAFGGFVLTCQRGQRTRFETSDWVAVDRKTYEELIETAGI